MGRKKRGAITLAEIKERREHEGRIVSKKHGRFITVPGYYPPTMIEVKTGFTEEEAINRFLNKPNKKTR